MALCHGIRGHLIRTKDSPAILVDRHAGYTVSQEGQDENNALSKRRIPVFAETPSQMSGIVMDTRMVRND